VDHVEPSVLVGLHALMMDVVQDVKSLVILKALLVLLVADEHHVLVPMLELVYKPVPDKRQCQV